MCPGFFFLSFCLPLKYCSTLTYRSTVVSFISITSQDKFLFPTIIRTNLCKFCWTNSSPPLYQNLFFLPTFCLLLRLVSYPSFSSVSTLLHASFVLRLNSFSFSSPQSIKLVSIIIVFRVKNNLALCNYFHKRTTLYRICVYSFLYNTKTFK